MDDVRFETIFEQSFGPIVDYWFYSKVAGATHRNKDRTLRSRIISRCQEFEQLDLVPEPDNPFDAHATAIVRRETGEQLGYVQARAAAEIARDTSNRRKWIAVLKEHNHHPETGRVVGANIVLARISGAVVHASPPAVTPTVELNPDVTNQATSTRMVIVIAVMLCVLLLGLAMAFAR